MRHADCSSHLSAFLPPFAGHFENAPMVHIIEFSTDVHADLEVSPKEPLRKVRIPFGTRLKAEIKPYVVEGDEGPVEVADLFFAGGMATRKVPFECFSLVDG
jgi:hypothetical protein